MRIVRSLKQCLSPAVQAELQSAGLIGVTIGNFDGFHRGHQMLFSRLDEGLKKRAADLKAKTSYKKVLLTFHPHPRAVLNKSDAAGSFVEKQSYLTSLRRKFELTAAFGFDIIFVIRFTKRFSTLTPEEFVKTYLVRALRVAVVVVGHDWSFGKSRAGTTEHLKILGHSCGFDAEIVEPVCLGEMRVSSSSVKNALINGDIHLLTDLLGRRFEISARVSKGAGRGRILGFPTANLRLHNQLLPPDGIYASFAVIDNKKYQAVAYIGRRPTYGPGERLVEVHILEGHDHQLYAKRIHLQFVTLVRPDKHFASSQALKEAIFLDCAQAREILAEHLQ